MSLWNRRNEFVAWVYCWLIDDSIILRELFKKKKNNYYKNKKKIKKVCKNCLFLTHWGFVINILFIYLLTELLIENPKSLLLLQLNLRFVISECKMRIRSCWQALRTFLISQVLHRKFLRLRENLIFKYRNHFLLKHKRKEDFFAPA